jgi:hypothetical protein
LNLNQLFALRGGGRQKSGGEKMKGSQGMLLKTNGEKMSVYGSERKSMKTNELKQF